MVHLLSSPAGTGAWVRLRDHLVRHLHAHDRVLGAVRHGQKMHQYQYRWEWRLALQVPSKSLLSTNNGKIGCGVRRTDLLDLPGGVG